MDAKQRLLDKQRDLLAEIGGLADQARDAAGPEVGDAGDVATASQGASESLEEVGVLSEMLSQVRDALRRIEDGTYGACIDCGRQIEPARLEAIPWARYCLADQEKHDNSD